MALGTLTLDTNGQRVNYASVTLGAATVTIIGESDYAAGGSTGLEAKLQAAIGRQATILAVLSNGLPYVTIGGAIAPYFPVYNLTTGKLMIMCEVSNAFAEPADHTNLSTVTLPLTVLYY